MTQSVTIARNQADDRRRPVPSHRHGRHDLAHDHRRQSARRRVRRRRDAADGRSQHRRRRDVHVRWVAARAAARAAREQRRADEHARAAPPAARRSTPARAARPPISAASPGRARATSAPSSTSAAAARRPADPGLPPPVVGKLDQREPESGTVRIKLPGSNRFRRLTEGEQLPVGTTVDTLQGPDRADRRGEQDRRDGDGRLLRRPLQAHARPKGSRPITTLTLVEKLALQDRARRPRRRREEEAAAVGRRQGPVPDQGQAQRGDGASARSGWSRTAARSR